MLEPPAAKIMSRVMLLRAAGAKPLLARVFEWQKKKKKVKKERRRRESRSIPPRKKGRKFRDFDFFFFFLSSLSLFFLPPGRSQERDPYVYS